MLQESDEGGQGREEGADRRLNFVSVRRWISYLPSQPWLISPTRFDTYFPFGDFDYRYRALLARMACLPSLLY